MLNNTKTSIDFLVETIKDLYAIELIFQDFKINEVVLVEGDTLFYIPYRNKRNYLIDILKCAYDKEKDFNRIYHMIISEAEKTLRDNTQDIDKLIKYAVDLALNN